MAEKVVKLTGQQLVQALENEKAKLDLLNRRMGSLQAIMREIVAAEASIKEIEKAKENEKIMVSLGAGVFFDATIQKKRKVLMTLAGDFLKYSSVNEAKADLKSRRLNLNKEIGGVLGESQKTTTNLNNLNKALATAARQQRKRAAN